MSVYNNLIYRLSQNLYLAERQNLLDEMEQRANQLAKLNFRCLRRDGSDSAQRDIAKTEAAFLDTVAAVQIALASRERHRPAQKERLCEAKKHADRAARLYETATAEPAISLSEEDSALGWKVLEARKKTELRYKAIEKATELKRRQSTVEARLDSLGLEC
jgi:hypothetical protein